MKTHPFLLFCALASLLPVSAQDKPAPKDPFVKTKPEEPVLKAMPPEEKRNVLCLLETITLPVADYAAWLDAAGGREKLYELAQAAVKNGSAKLDGCHFLANQHGTRAALRGVDELMYPTEWTPADSTGFQYPTALEMHKVGDLLEFECILPPGQGAAPITLGFTRDRFEGFLPAKADATLPGAPVASFVEQQGNTSYKMVPGVPQLMSTLKSTQAGVITLVFGTFEVVSFNGPPKPAPKGAGNLQITARVISLDRTAGCALLKKHRQDDTACLTELKSMIGAKQAVLEHLSTVVTSPDMVATYRSGPLFTYGTEFAAPTSVEVLTKDPKKGKEATPPGGTAATTQTESRQLGVHWSVECNVDEVRMLANTTLTFSNTQMSGVLRDKLWPERWPELPLFSEQNITTGVLQPLNSTLLIGSLNPPGDTGANEHQDDGKMWLVFFDIHQD